MKKLIFLTILLSFTSTFAQNDLTGMKFCLDPGHGDYPNDKPYETRINLRVANFLRDYLKNYGAWVITTRQDSAVNISLSEREYIANSNNVDFFLSVHHNAFQGNANYTLMLYEEKPSGQPEWPGEADVMCNIMADYLHRYLYTTGKSVRGDWSFYNPPFNLGVLNDLIMPGVLSEASFWDYPPEVHRLNSLGYLRLEAFALVHSFLDYYSIPKKEDAFLEGVVQELNGEKLSGITVKLTDGVDEMIYVTDSQNIGITDADRSWGGFPQIYDVRNGMYFFENFPLGQAKLIFEGKGLVGDTVDVMVIARTSTRVSPVELVEDMPPTIVATLPADGDNFFSPFDEISIEFSRPMDKTTVENAFQLLPQVNGNFSWQDRNKQFIFSPKTRFEFNQSHTLEISGEAIDAWGYYLDGNGDGVAGDSFSLTFRTAPMDTSKPMVIEFYPAKSDTGIFINDLIRA
jgi:N-acetylmuramoyl-L-alanine amidase